MSLFSRKPNNADLRAKANRKITARIEANSAIRRAPVEGAQLYLYPNYLTDAQCDKLIELIDANRRPSTLLATHHDPEFRTSDSCDLDRWSPDVQVIDDGIAALLGIPTEHGETIQGQRYAPGQQFKAHCDYFHEDQYYWKDMAETGGQRTWTGMVYLNTVEEGGATWFPRAGIRVAPKKGLLLLWNNLKDDGTGNFETLHEGMRVIEGTKYVITKWFRERPWIRTHVQTY